MGEKNNPVDIGTEEIAGHKKPVEDLFTSYTFRRKTHSLPELLRRLDPEEEYVMNSVERDTYLAVREGMQIFKAMTKLLADKVELRKKLIATPNSELSSNPELTRLREFCHNYATYVSSRYISKKLEGVIHAEGEIDTGAKPDLSALTLDSKQPEEGVIKRLLLPLYAQLIEHADDGEAFKTPLEFPVFVKEVFDKYVELAGSQKPSAALAKHLEGYTFRIMDEFLVLEGYEDRSTPTIHAVEQKVAFQPITPKEIVGNRSAKRKLTRYIERMALYDPREQMNPILELGGLSWSNLFDGLPGTGKSSLFRLAMTLLSERAQEVELPYHIVTVDQSVKDEYYGKTGKMLLQRLAITNDPSGLTIAIFDDIDLLTSSRQDAQGADNDINNIIMQYMDGVFTVRRGNVINFAASNEPTGVDDALRNRFNDRLLIDGPVTNEDFADMFVLMGKNLFERDLLPIEQGYAPFTTQDNLDASGHWSGEDVAAYMAEEMAHSYKEATILDFGKFMKDLKDKNPKITGRSARAIIEAIKERSADFDIPREWLENRAEFLDLPYKRKVQMLGKLYTKITPDVLFQEAQRYADSEQRYAQTEQEGHVTRGYNTRKWDMEAQLKFLEEQAAQGDNSDMAKVVALQTGLQAVAHEKARTIKNALENDKDA